MNKASMEIDYDESYVRADVSTNGESVVILELREGKQTGSEISIDLHMMIPEARHLVSALLLFIRQAEEHEQKIRKIAGRA